MPLLEEKSSLLSCAAETGGARALSGPASFPGGELDPVCERDNRGEKLGPEVKTSVYLCMGSQRKRYDLGGPFVSPRRWHKRQTLEITLASDLGLRDVTFSRRDSESRDT